MKLSPRGTFGRTWALLAALCVIATFTACRTVPPVASEPASAKAARFSFWQPHLLLTSPRGPQRLEIEIDHVQGCGPTEAELRSLKDFFSAHCPKPGGVSLRVDAAIPRSLAKGKSHKALAELHLDGPVGTNAAFVYFLFYDGHLTGLPERNPETLRVPFPGAAFINRAYLRRMTWLPGTGDISRRMILHEAGHVLGLCGNPTHGDGVHCTNRACLMNETLQVRYKHLFLPGPVAPQRDFCAGCLADLTAYREQVSADNLRFIGPYCVRSEPGYHVLTTPGYVRVVIGPHEAVDFATLKAMRHAAFRDNPQQVGVFYSLNVPSEEVARLIPLLERDPLVEVRELGAKLREKVK